jgi:acylphosphatase
VYYRESVRQQAGQYGVQGWIQNLPDGRVEACLEGEEMAVAKLLDFLHSGPPLARVENVLVEELPAGGEYTEFAVRRRNT